MTDLTPPPSDKDIAPVGIEDEMRRAYLDYAMSVIVARALPEVRDGLKPVHRRILYAMKIGGYDSTKPTKKSSRIVGDVMGQFHPHGDSSIYDAMVRLAQDFSMRLPLIQGQGNFGSMDGDPPAAMRYTEARLSKAAEALLEDIDKETVDFQANYDETTDEPTVLPARFPNLLVNGAGGIAVGMATNIPPHNLGEVIAACCALIDDPELSPETLLEYVPGPDFPTGGIIVGRSGSRAAALTGRGSVLVRARTEIETIRKDRQAIIVTEIPFQVNKARLQERITEAVRDGHVEGVSELRDESDRDGVRVVIELKRDATPDVVLNQLFRATQLQTTFGVNILALNGGKPELLSLKDVLLAFIAFREEVITRRTTYELRKARERAHILCGLAVAVANVDRVIQLIREAPDPQTARERLLAIDWPAGEVLPLVRLVEPDSEQIGDAGTYRLSEAQAKAILDLRLHRLTGLERDKIGADLAEIVERIKDYLEILASRDRLMGVLRDELVAVGDQFGTPRRTAIEDLEFEADIEALIEREDMVVTVSSAGYIKRTPLDTYRAQGRGGKGRSGMATRDEDYVTELFVANTHTALLFFTSTGQVYKLKTHRLPLGSPQSRGRALVNLLPLVEGEAVSTVMPLPDVEEEIDGVFIMFATANGNVRRNRLAEFIEVKANGKIAMKLDPGDRLIGVATCGEGQDVVLATQGGKCIRFPVDDIRVFAGRDSIGVRGIRLASDDTVISLSLLAQMEPDADVREAYHKQSMARRAVEACKRGLVELDRRIATLETSLEEGAEKSLETALARREREQVRLPELEQTAAELAPLLDQRTFMRLAEAEQFLLTVTENGYGKLSSSYRFRQSRRGGQGIASFDVSLRAASMAAVFEAASGDQVIMSTDAGKVLRIPLTRVPVRGRQTAGVRLFNVDGNERIVAVAHLSEALLNTGDDDSDLDADLENGDIGESDGDGDSASSAANPTTPDDQSGPAADGSNST